MSESQTPALTHNPELSKNEIIAMGLIVTAAVSAFGAFFWHQQKEDKKYLAEAKQRQAEQKEKRAERQDWFDTQRKNGMTVIETHDGNYLAVPSEAYAKAEIRRKAL